jgi:hypothetical protein
MMSKVVVIVSPAAWNQVRSSHRYSIDGVTLKQRLLAYQRFLIVHFDDARVFEDAGTIRVGLRRIQHERLDGFYLVKRVAYRKWWKFWSRKVDTFLRIEFLSLIHHPGVKQ